MPAAQGVQAPAVGPEYEPASQSAQEVIFKPASSELYCPAAHEGQTSVDALEAYWPSGHQAHCRGGAPVAGRPAYRPAAQGAQEPRKPLPEVQSSQMPDKPLVPAGQGQMEYSESVRT
mmetsp:Transcript_90052/g.179804  ORF Transcript_90052/g.179804 Transcript_90052/m.179804 type:complete len:118 (-) Transcript_90052:38-391(-)